MTAQPDARFDDDAVAAVAGYGIPGSLTSLPEAAMPTDGWSCFVKDVRAHNLAGLLGAAVCDEAMPVTSAQADDVDGLLADSRRLGHLLDEAVVSAVNTLTSAGVETRVLDGTAVARLDYRDPTLRTFGGAELLVRHEMIARAVAVLSARGYRPRPSTARDGRRASPESVCFTSPNGMQVTVLDRPRWLTGDPNELWQGFEAFELDGHPLCTLAREERLLDTCWRTTTADHDFGAKRDVAESVLHKGLDTQRALRLADAWEVLPVIATSVRSTWVDLQLADVVALSTWARSWHDGKRRLPLANASSRRAIGGPLGLLARALDSLPGMTR